MAVATAAGLDLKIVSIDDEEARDLYESDLVLIRPDQIVAWRLIADTVVDPAKVLACALGGTANGGTTNDSAMNNKAAPLCEARDTVRLRIQ